MSDPIITTSTSSLNLSLGQKQKLFTFLIGKLISWSYANGYELTFGEAVRTVAQAESNASSGIGIRKSNHLIRLAIDLNLFVGGNFKTASEDYRALGAYWKSLNSLCCWGGDFSKPDGNHFSLLHEGVR